MARKIPQPHGGAMNRFEKGESGNPKGRPPKLATTVIRELKERGIARVDRTEVDELIGRVQNLTARELRELAAADDTPVVVALIARGMLGKAGHEFLVRDLWDRQHGRPKQQLDLQGNLAVAPVTLSVVVQPPSDAASGK